MIELLTVIAIVGILAAILIPTVGKVRETARRTVDASNIRQIGQSSLLFANENDQKLPGLKLNFSSATGTYTQNGASDATVQDVAAALALSGLNDTSMWVSQSDTGLTTPAVTPGPILKEDRSFAAGFTAASQLSIDYVAGLTTARPPTMPVAFSRGLQTTGGWSANGVYKQDGGHIVFLGGNVSFFRDVGTFDPQAAAGAGASSNGRLVKASDGSSTANIQQAIPATTGTAAAQVVSAMIVGAGPGSLDGTKGAGP